MVETRTNNLSPANPGRLTTTTGGLVPAVSRSNVTLSITDAGDSVTTSSKTATGGLLSSQPGSAFAGTSSTETNVHSSMSYGATSLTMATSHGASTNPIGQQALENASANPDHSRGWALLSPGLVGFFEPLPVPPRVPILAPGN